MLSTAFDHCFDPQPELEDIKCDYEDGRLSFQIPPHRFLKLDVARLNVALPKNPHLIVHDSNGSCILNSSCHAYRPHILDTTDLASVHSFFRQLNGTLYVDRKGWTITIRTTLSNPPANISLRVPRFRMTPEGAAIFQRCIDAGVTTRIVYQEPEVALELKIKSEVVSITS